MGRGGRKGHAVHGAGTRQATRRSRLLVLLLLHDDLLASALSKGQK